ncbi:hypothetical protein PCYB_031130 [Plasmodium cynomolgi strain B]|uniref:Uncharacterized protein n=1 Tax=Plasmodium cynomolgi (strain B) TaxID=1120755 RepID=K6US06_PLACD|nr:hypothetical protein PCYB_031130 [Plasmodium cynomolgi strain B]GAB64700.1 hypothetical protein PCYB_031130 [Plasmodium cynomolgi strain B]
MFAQREEAKNHFPEFMLNGSGCYDFAAGDSLGVNYMNKLKNKLFNFGSIQTSDVDDAGGDCRNSEGSALHAGGIGSTNGSDSGRANMRRHRSGEASGEVTEEVSGMMSGEGMVERIAKGVAEGITENIAQSITENIAQSITDNIAQSVTDNIAEGTGEIPREGAADPAGKQDGGELGSGLDSISYVNPDVYYKKEKSNHSSAIPPVKEKRERTPSDYLNIKKSKLINNLNFFMRVCCNKNSYIKFINHYFNIIYCNNISILFKYEGILQKFDERNEMNLTENDYYNGYVKLNQVPIVIYGNGGSGSEKNGADGSSGDSGVSGVGGVSGASGVGGVSGIGTSGVCASGSALGTPLSEIKIDMDTNQECLKNNSNLESSVLNFINIYDNLTVNFFNHIFTKINNNEMNINNSNIDLIIHNFLYKKHLLKENIFNLLLNISKSYEMKYGSVLAGIKNDEHVKERNEKIIFEMLKDKVEGRITDSRKRGRTPWALHFPSHSGGSGGLYGASHSGDLSVYHGADYNSNSQNGTSYGSYQMRPADSYDHMQEGHTKRGIDGDPESMVNWGKSEMHESSHGELNELLSKSKESETADIFCEIKDSNMSNSNFNNMISNNTDATTTTAGSGTSTSTGCTTGNMYSRAAEMALEERVAHVESAITSASSVYEFGENCAQCGGTMSSSNCANCSNCVNGHQSGEPPLLQDIKEMLNKEIESYEGYYCTKGLEEEEEEEKEKNENIIENIYTFLKNNVFIPSNNIYTDFMENGNDIFLSKIKKSDKATYFKLIERFDRMYNFINEFKSSYSTNEISEERVSQEISEPFPKYRKRRCSHDEYESRNASHTKRCLRNCNGKRNRPIKRSKRIIKKAEMSRVKKMK